MLSGDFSKSDTKPKGLVADKRMLGRSPVVKFVVDLAMLAQVCFDGR